MNQAELLNNVKSWRFKLNGVSNRCIKLIGDNNNFVSLFKILWMDIFNRHTYYLLHCHRQLENWVILISIWLYNFIPNTLWEWKENWHFIINLSSFKPHGKLSKLDD